MRFDLKSYLNRFDEVCRKKFEGRTYHLLELEEHFDAHRQGKKLLQAKDVEKIFDEELTPFKKYWLPPRTTHLERTLRRVPLRLGPLNEINHRQLIDRLLKTCHSLGTASLVLRFAHPEEFAIFSTPIIHLLQVSSPNSAELYIQYCKELGVWKDRFGISTVAQTEMALWTSYQLSKGEDQEAKKVLKDFEDDDWVQGRRLANTLGPFLKRRGRLELARILLDTDHILAGKIAAEEYERLLDLKHRTEYTGKPLPRAKGAAPRFLDQLVHRGRLRIEDKVELMRTWETRNKVTHAGDQPEPVEVEVMIDRIMRLCRPWEAGIE